MEIKNGLNSQKKKYYKNKIVAACTSIEHQELIVQNVLKNVMISPTLAYYWMCTTIKKLNFWIDEEL